MKNTRQEKILELIGEHDVETQEELASLLADHGFRVTQATVSRDIRELELHKTEGPGGKMRYVRAAEHTEEKRKLSRVLQDAVLSMDVSGNILVIHTSSGMAMAAAAALDALDLKEIIGSIAGDDTVMAVVAEDADPHEVRHGVEDLIRR